MQYRTGVILMVTIIVLTIVGLGVFAFMVPEAREVRQVCLEPKR